MEPLDCKSLEGPKGDEDLWCKLPEEDWSDAKKPNELTRDECNRGWETEWVPSTVACMNCGNLSDENKWRIKQKFNDKENWEQAALQDESIDLERDTIRSLDLRRKAAYCREGRDRTATQPSSYNTDTSIEDETDDETPEEVPWA